MPSPSTPTTYERPDLGMYREDFDLQQHAGGFVAARVFPLTEVGLYTANYSRVKLEELKKKRRSSLKRAPNAGYNRDRLEYEQVNYKTEERGHEELLDDRERAAFAYTIDADEVQSQRATHVVMEELEEDVASQVFDPTTNFASYKTSISTAWTNLSGSDPVADMRAAKNNVRSQCGLKADAVIISYLTMEKLQDNDSIIDRIKYWGRDDPKEVTARALAALIGVSDVIVAGGLENTADEGQSASLSDLWNPDYVMLAKLCRSRDPREIGLGRLWHWSGDGSSPMVAIDQYREEPRRSDVTRARMDYHAQLIYAQAGHMLTGTGVS